MEKFKLVMNKEGFAVHTNCGMDKKPVILKK